MLARRVVPTPVRSQAAHDTDDDGGTEDERPVFTAVAASQHEALSESECENDDDVDDALGNESSILSEWPDGCDPTTLEFAVQSLLQLSSEKLAQVFAVGVVRVASICAGALTESLSFAAFVLVLQSEATSRAQQSKYLFR